MSREKTIERPHPTARKRRQPSTSPSVRGASARPVAPEAPKAQSRFPRSPSDLRSGATVMFGRYRVAVVGVLVVLVTLAALYVPVRELYVAWRTNGVLQEESARVSEETAELEGDIESLMTEDGIKDEARKRGYVEDGETRIVVEGLDGEDAGASADEPDAADTPWYLGIGDLVFGYQGE